MSINNCSGVIPKAATAIEGSINSRFIPLRIAEADRIAGHQASTSLITNSRRSDKDIRDDVNVPQNYYIDDNPANKPNVTWRAHANLLFNNWINYYLL